MKTYLFSPNPTVFRWQKIHFPLTLSVTPLQTGSVTVPLPLPPVSSQTSLTRPLPPPLLSLSCPNRPIRKRSRIPPPSPPFKLDMLSTTLTPTAPMSNKLLPRSRLSPSLVIQVTSLKEHQSNLFWKLLIASMHPQIPIGSLLTASYGLPMPQPHQKPTTMVGFGPHHHTPETTTVYPASPVDQCLQH